MTVPLPVPDDLELAELLLSFPDYERRYSTPRSAWLHDVEAILRRHYPEASSNELTLTARNLAPFPLVLPGVP